MVAADLTPRGPYNLELSARGANDATRSWKDGILDAELPSGRAVAWQHLDGRVTVRATTEGAFEEMRFCLGIDDDHSEFLRRFRTDPFLGAAIKRYHGLRPLRLRTVAHALLRPLPGGLRPIRLGTVAQSLLRALCGQLILASEARRIERVIIRATTERRRPRHHA